MAERYRAFDPAGVIRSQTLKAVFHVLQMERQRKDLLTQFSLPDESQMGEWISWQTWLNMLEYIEEHYSGKTVYSIGLQIINVSVWPQNIHTMHEGLNALDIAYKMNIRGEKIGSYEIEGKGLRSVRIVCDTPNPADFDCGIITGITRKFKPLGAVRVRVEPEETTPQSPSYLKWFHVSW